VRERNPSIRERWLTFIRFWQILGVILAEVWKWLFQRQSLPDHLYRAVVQLGPTFIKLGQVASTRPDLVPAEISTRFKTLQEQVPQFPFTEARQVIEIDLKKPLYEAFSDFPEEPVATASLAQVYFAALPDGSPVAVKVQRPGIDNLISRDLAILRWLARLAQRLSRVAHDLRLETAASEFGRWTLKELDFAIEGHNAEEFRRNFASWEDVVFPKVYWSHTTRRILTMERLSGLRVDDVAQQVGPAFGDRLARRLAEMEMKMFISDAFFHADLHPGNIFFQPDGRIAVLDLGMVGRMTPAQRDRFLAYWIAITRRQCQRAFHHLTQMADSMDGADLEAFRDRYDVILDRFYDKNLSGRSLAQTYLEIVVEGARFGIVFPPEMILQAKAIVTAEALDLVLAPHFNFTEEVRPIVAYEFARRATPARIADRLWGSLAEWILLGEAMPAGEAPSDEVEDERQFRRWAKTALADAWTDEVVGRLRDLQSDLPSYMSANYWTEHPERHALLQTCLSLLRLFATGFRCIQREEDLNIDLVPAGVMTVSKNGKPLAAKADAPEARWQNFHEENEGYQEGSRLVGDEYMQAYAYLEKLSRQYTYPTFWDSRSEGRASLTSLITLLRFLVFQLDQTAHESIWQDAEGE
jgi:predicted unusual protein kinase regulating ubiquinone biosynthesis (AarF/ABC1/UbiB family)